MSVFSSIRDAVTGAAVKAGSAYIKDKTGANIETISEEAKRSLAAKGTNTANSNSAPSPKSTVGNLPSKGMPGWVIPAAIAVGLLVVVMVVSKRAA